MDETMHDVEESIDTIDAESQNYDSESVLPSDKVADLVELIVCGLVADPEAVSLDVSDGDDGALIEISCAEQDAGKVIGRRGRTIKAIRTIARACGQRVGTAVEVEVLG